MTRFKFILGQSSHIVGFSIIGHAGYAAHGGDIVCAGISGGVQLLEIGIENILGLNEAFKKNKAKAIIICKMPENLSDEEKEKFFLLTDTFYQYILQLERQYKKHIYVVKRRLNHVEN